MDYGKDTQLWLGIIKKYPKRFPQIIKKDHQAFYNFIDAHNIGITFSQKLYNFINANAQLPKCKHCKINTVIFLSFTRGYRSYCSKKCQVNSIEYTQSRRLTCIKKYGVEHFSKTDEYKSKFKKTCMDKYGVTNPGQIKENIKIRSRKKQLTFFNDKLSNSWTTFSEPLFTFGDYNKVRDMYNWKCNTCGEPFISHVFNKIPKCPVCYPTGNTGGQSSVERSVIEYIRTIYNGIIDTNNRQMISPKEIDIFLPEYNLGIEICGVYWHSDDKIKDKYYHYNKFLQCEAVGITLLTILDFEWANNVSASKELITSQMTTTLPSAVQPNTIINLRNGGLGIGNGYNFIEPKPWQTVKHELISNDDERFLSHGPKFWDCGYREYY